ncbi:MAG: hypothetical protein QOC72_1784 [Methylobacteriaceae bacterium]|jgi:hypothetical protein|nr:hypothetical protein [Methylobacteriaceae bacterium]
MGAFCLAIAWEEMMDHGSPLSAAKRRFLTDYSTRERLLAAVNGPDQHAAEKAVRDLGALSNEDLSGALAAVRTRSPAANAFESDLIRKYDAVAGEAQ